MLRFISSCCVHLIRSYVHSRRSVLRTCSPVVSVPPSRSCFDSDCSDSRSMCHHPCQAFPPLHPAYSSCTCFVPVVLFCTTSLHHRHLYSIKLCVFVVRLTE
ncbi:hypothetical protein BV25DRAFT_276643 [Artomyces pyxidatus]|uniref:Uncharacterized protein n=1 Tax=Artomyces pyxidatus TaxID=48021 RepID=A0ACB8T8Q8_9AGAM|nr:hypothetical protein BV25DRAFT_276643 [Artomyces pyxidatus]